jgi:hypothetical protein
MASTKSGSGQLGAKIGGFVLKIASEMKRAGSDLTIAEILELTTRPVRHVCLLCGNEPQDPYGAALGTICKAKVKEAGVGVAVQAGETVKQLTVPEIIEIFRAAKAGGALDESADGRTEGE